MIERAARALWEVSGRPYKAQDTIPAASPPEPEPDWEPFVPTVRLVLRAIRSPDEAMVDAARAEAWAAGTSIRQHEIEGIFRAMITAALDEK